MAILQVLAASSAAGKTVWSVGLVRALRDAGYRVAPFKAVSEDEHGHEVPGGVVSNSAMHLMAASGRKPSGNMNPVVLVPTGVNCATVILLGEIVGEVHRIGRDMVFLDDLAPSIQRRIDQVTLDCLASVEREADIVVAEGSGGATDLSILDAWDLANVRVAMQARATVLIARASSGGGLASLEGVVRHMDKGVRSSLRGIALTDVRVRQSSFVAAGKRLSHEMGVTFLGATPWISFFEGRPPYAPYTPESDQDHLVLAKSLWEGLAHDELLNWIGLGSSVGT